MQRVQVRKGIRSVPEEYRSIKEAAEAKGWNFKTQQVWKARHPEESVRAWKGWIIEYMNDEIK